VNFIEDESSQKLRGGYYTPLDLARFLAQWVSQDNPKSVLEPSCGDGVFFSALAHTKSASLSKVTSFELDPSEAGKARARARQLNLSAQIHTEDFLNWALDEFSEDGTRFDAVIGNPPFIRYQYLPAEFQERSERVFRHLDCHFTKHTNAWVPFILASLALLRPGGRLAMVVPAELIHVSHAQSLRTYLGQVCHRVVIVDPEEIWFSDTLQGAVLLLAEKKQTPDEATDGLGIYPVRGREFTNLDPAGVFATPQAINGKTVAGKWTHALVNKATRDLIDELTEHPEIYRFSEVAEASVGIVTGANKYFLVSNDVVERYQLQEWAHPMFGRSDHCPGILYDEWQHQANVDKGKPTNFIWFQDESALNNKAARAYIQFGEEQELHTRFKCRVRSPWYSVPSVSATEIGMLKRSHDAPRLILNKVGAYTTDTAYRVRSHKVPAEVLVASFINPLTALSAELEGRHYGGGVLELVPSEIKRLHIPLPTKAKLDLDNLDKAVRSLPRADVLEEHGGRVLSALGLTSAQKVLLFDGWMSLRNRRHRTPSNPVVS
jgi:adenine-specific DNA methylase